MAEPRAIFIDTSAHYAVINTRDLDHFRAEQFLKGTTRGSHTLLTTNYIVGETYTLLRRKLGHFMAVGYIEDLPRFCNIVRVEPDDEERAWQIIKQHDDKDYSYVDATSFAVMERLNLKRAFAFDKHFEQYGYQKLPEEGR